MELRSGRRTQSDQEESALGMRKTTIRTLPVRERAAHEAREARNGLIPRFLGPRIVTHEPKAEPEGH